MEPAVRKSEIGVELLGRYSNSDIATRLERILSGRGRDRPPARPTRSPRRLSRLTGDEVAELGRLRQDGAEINDLAARFGLSRSAVMANLERAGVPGRRWPGRTLSPDELMLARELYESGLSLADVGEQLGVDRRYLRRALPAQGVTIRAPGRQSRRH